MLDLWKQVEYFENGWIRGPQLETNLFKSGFVIHDTKWIRIYGLRVDPWICKTNPQGTQFPDSCNLTYNSSETCNVCKASHTSKTRKIDNTIEYWPRQVRQVRQERQERQVRHERQVRQNICKASQNKIFSQLSVVIFLYLKTL